MLFRSVAHGKVLLEDVLRTTSEPQAKSFVVVCCGFHLFSFLRFFSIHTPNNHNTQPPALQQWRRLQSVRTLLPSFLLLRAFPWRLPNSDGEKKDNNNNNAKQKTTRRIHLSMRGRDSRTIQQTSTRGWNSSRPQISWYDSPLLCCRHRPRKRRLRR